MRSKTRVGIAVVCAALMLGATSPLAAQDMPCSACGPGDHWVDACAEGDDNLSSTQAVVGIDMDGDCVADVSRILNGPTTIHRDAGVPHSIQTEIVSMSLTGEGVTLTAGLGQGQGGVLPASLGVIVETADPALADSSFDVFFEIDLGGGSYVYNHDPLTISDVINCVPPDAEYIHPTGCLPLYDDPVGGDVVARLVSARHITYTFIPTVSEWGLIALTLLVVTAGAIIVHRRRRLTAGNVR